MPGTRAIRPDARSSRKTCGDCSSHASDLRAAAGWRVNDKFSLGIAAHLFTGDNLVAISRVFDDTTKFGTVDDSSRVVFAGNAFSLGGEWRIRKGWAATASLRAGGGMSARIRDTIRSEANVPNRVGVGLRYDGIPGSLFAVGVDKTNWTAMKGLGSAAVETHDATNWHVGAEVAGPRLRQFPVLIRAGYAKNTLPFGIGGKVVDESRFSAGIGLPVAREAASIDISLQRANRSLNGGIAKESAWLLGVGMQIRP